MQAGEPDLEVRRMWRSDAQDLINRILSVCNCMNQSMDPIVNS